MVTSAYPRAANSARAVSSICCSRSARGNRVLMPAPPAGTSPPGEYPTATRAARRASPSCRDLLLGLGDHPRVTEAALRDAERVDQLARRRPQVGAQLVDRLDDGLRARAGQPPVLLVVAALGL